MAAAAEEIPDYYVLLGVQSDAPREVIVKAVRDSLQKWHPDKCRLTNAHDKTVEILEAKNVLLNPESRQRYDAARRHAAQESSASKAAWQQSATAARTQAEQEASIDLDAILGSLASLLGAGAIAATVASVEGSKLAWQGQDRYYGTTRAGPSIWHLFMAGVGGWAFIICLLVPGSSLFTLFIFAFAFWPPPDQKFIGVWNLLLGMLLSGFILLFGLVALLVLIIAAA